MSTEFVIFGVVVFVRLLVPFSILRWPLAGIVLSILADAADIMVFEKIGGPGPIAWEDYHLLDKVLDTYYLAFAAFVAWRWRDKLARNIALALFGWRLAGVVAFEFYASMTGELVRPLMFFAPNIFEHFVVAYLLIRLVKPQFRFGRRSALVTLLIVTALKMPQEYILHFGYQDRTWGFLRDNVFWWLY